MLRTALVGSLLVRLFASNKDVVKISFTDRLKDLRDAKLMWPFKTFGPQATLLIIAVMSQILPATSNLILPIIALIGLWFVFDSVELFEMPFDSQDRAILVWLLVWLLSALFAIHLSLAFALSVPVLIFALLFFLLKRAGPIFRNGFEWALCFLATLQAGQILLASANQTIAQNIISQTHSPWLLVPNDVVWMLCLWPMWWSRAWQYKRAYGFLLLAIFGFQFAAMIAVQSRLAILIAVSLMITALLSRAFSIKEITKSKMVFFVGLIATIAIAGTASILWLGKGIASLQSRLQLAESAWQLWLQYPWFGVGPHGFGLEHRNVIEESLIDVRRAPWPHQLPLELLANTGLIGFIAFLRVIYFSLKQNIGPQFNRHRSNLPLLCAFVTLFAVSMVEASTLRMWWWIALAYLLSFGNNARAQNLTLTRGSKTHGP